MGNFFSERTPNQLSGDVSLVKGEMFEHIVEVSENMDGDVWTAQLHELRTVPDSDIVFTNIETGQQAEVSLKSTYLPHYIEGALEKYPDIPILTTEEMEQYFGDHPLCGWGSNFRSNCKNNQFSMALCHSLFEKKNYI
jgi:hypothetical protein